MLALHIWRGTPLHGTLGVILLLALSLSQAKVKD